MRYKKNKRIKKTFVENLHFSERTSQQLNEVANHCGMRTDAWALHVIIFGLAFCAYASAIQLSSPIAEVEMPYFAKIMPQALAMELWQLTTFVSLLVFLYSLPFKALSKVTIWAAGTLIGSALWGAVQFFITLGQAFYSSVSDGLPVTNIQAIYAVPFYSVLWLLMMLLMAHTGLVALRKTGGKYFLTSWHELPTVGKVICPFTLATVTLLQSNTAIFFLFEIL